MHDFIVIGSGLSGVSAAKEILAAGKSVLMIDIGKENSENALALQKKNQNY
jgi:choline dehydrogenase-like flavoprotein